MFRYFKEQPDWLEPAYPRVDGDPSDESYISPELAWQFQRPKTYRVKTWGIVPRLYRPIGRGGTEVRCVMCNAKNGQLHHDDCEGGGANRTIGKSHHFASHAQHQHILRRQYMLASARGVMGSELLMLKKAWETEALAGRVPEPPNAEAVFKRVGAEQMVEHLTAEAHRRRSLDKVSKERIALLKDDDDLEEGGSW